MTPPCLWLRQSTKRAQKMQNKTLLPRWLWSSKWGAKDHCSFRSKSVANICRGNWHHAWLSRHNPTNHALSSLCRGSIAKVADYRRISHWGAIFHYPSFNRMSLQSKKLNCLPTLALSEKRGLNSENRSEYLRIQVLWELVRINLWHAAMQFWSPIWLLSECRQRGRLKRR